MDYARVDDALCYARPVGDGTLTLRADAIHQERTGVHARLSIAYQGVTLAWSTFNIERDEDRVRLVNSAHKQLNGQATEYPVAYLKKDVDLFCFGLWDASLGDLDAEWMAGTEEPVPTVFALEPYVVHGGGTIVFAHPGRGKSILTLLWAVSIDAGADIAPERRLWKVRPQRVLLINLERHKTSVANRLGNVNAALGLPRTRTLLTMNQRGKSLADVIPAARKMVREHGIQVVLLDSISRAGLGDLTENNPVNKIIDGLNGLAPTWIGIAHAPRSSNEHLYGSIHFEAGADVVVRLLSQQDEGGPLGIGLQITKENDVGKRRLEILALEFAAYGLTGVRDARPGEFPDVEESRQPSGKQLVVDYLVHAGTASASAIAQETGLNRSNVSTLLNHDPSFQRRGMKGASVLFGVVAP
jgi:hypothetical protein